MKAQPATRGLRVTVDGSRLTGKMSDKRRSLGFFGGPTTELPSEQLHSFRDTNDESNFVRAYAPRFPPAHGRRHGHDCPGIPTEPERGRGPARASGRVAGARMSICPLHRPQRIKRIIWLYMAGGLSHLESFDYKPELARRHGQPMPDSLTRANRSLSSKGLPLRCLGPQHPFRKWGRSGQEIATIFPHIGTVADEICIIRSLKDRCDQPRPGPHLHEYRLALAGRPAMGSWVITGLGSDSQDLPGFVVLTSTGRFGTIAAHCRPPVAQRLSAQPIPGHPCCAAPAIRFYISPTPRRRRGPTARCR